MGTTQISIRLSDRLVEFIDEQVSAGAGSRANVVRKALLRYDRYLADVHDAEIYRTTPDDPDLAAMTEWVSRNMPSLD